MKNKKTAVSVVIPTYNGQKLLAKHLPSVVKILEPGDEVIIADDASTDNTVAWLEQQLPVFTAAKLELRWVHLEKNQRFAAAVNAGVSLAEHPYVLLLNNDVSPLSPDLRAQLLTWFQDDDFFAVGCAEVKENTPDAPLYGRGTGIFRRGLLFHWYDPDQKHHETLWTTGGSMMFDKTKFFALGGFDTLFYPAYQEDRDLSYRAVKHGWQIAFEYRVCVWHQHETTNQSVFGDRQMTIDSWKNQYLLVWKNITDPQMLLQHFLWLPYYLSVANWKTQGAAGLGLWFALRQLPRVWRQRQAVKKLWKLSDKEVFTQAQAKNASLNI